MKLLYGSLLLLFVSNVSYSQSREEIGYVEYSYNDGSSGQRTEKLWFTKDKMMLKIIEASVRNWSKFANKTYTSLEDSLADEKIIHDLDERHKKDRQEMYKATKDVFVTRTNATNGESFCYHDTLRNWKWELTSDTTTIAGFHCLKAYTTFSSGRKLYVWYAPELAVPFGPHMFHGLPGLILAGSSNDGAYKIDMLQIEIPYKGNINMTPCVDSKFVTKAEFMQHVHQSNANAQQKLFEQFQKQRRQNNQ